jgi:hypothetical protein
VVQAALLRQIARIRFSSCTGGDRRNGYTHLEKKMADKRDESKQQQLLQRRFTWAGELLGQLGFEHWGESSVHGRSEYYIAKGSSEDEDFEDQVRIRVSDHYAHQFRSDMGIVSVDFTVQVDPSHKRHQVERLVRDRVSERTEYLNSDAWEQFRDDNGLRID